MNKKLNLAVAKRGIALDESFELDMRSFCGSEEGMPKTNACGTSFCFAGYLAALDGHPEEFIYGADIFMYERYSVGLLGVSDSCDDPWAFFFEYNWPSTFKDLKERCQYVIDNNGAIPEEFNSRENTWSNK